MKTYGKITDYNGVYGHIIGEDGIKYQLLDRNIVSEKVEVNDIVEFEEDNIKTDEIEFNVARFVKVKKL